MSSFNLPASDLHALQKDVLQFGHASALPCELTDRWLALVARDLESCLGTNEAGYAEGGLAAPIALVIHLLVGKADGMPLEISFEDLDKRIREYWLEISLEQVSRRTGLAVTPATLETIFDRKHVTLNCVDARDPFNGSNAER